jgi:hypothetical protein
MYLLLLANHLENTRHLAAKLLDKDIPDSGSSQLLKSGPHLDDVLITARLLVPRNEAGQGPDQVQVVQVVLGILLEFPTRASI